MESSSLMLVGLGALAFYSFRRLRPETHNEPQNPATTLGGRPYRTRANKTPGVVEDWPDPTEWTDAEDRARRGLFVLAY